MRRILGEVSSLMFWLPMCLALTALGLLLVFQSVVRQGVRLGDQRRQETAQREEATWRCKALPEHRLRMACLGDLGIFPAPLLNVINPAVDRVMISVGATDPTPTVALGTSVEGTDK